MSDPTIFHNPRCSKSRHALAFLQANGSVNVIRYLESPPSVAELDGVCSLLGVGPEQLIRTKEARFRELGLSLDDPRSREEWLTLLVENPILIERPIVIANGKAVVGRPPERVLDLI